MCLKHMILQKFIKCYKHVYLFTTVCICFTQILYLFAKCCKHFKNVIKSYHFVNVYKTAYVFTKVCKVLQNMYFLHNVVFF